LAIIQMPGVTPVGDAGFLHPPQNSVELLIAHVKGVMMTSKELALSESKVSVSLTRTGAKWPDGPS